MDSNKWYMRLQEVITEGRIVYDKNCGHFHIPSAVPSTVLNSTEKGRSDCPVVTTLKVAEEPSATV